MIFPTHYTVPLHPSFIFGRQKPFAMRFSVILYYSPFPINVCTLRYSNVQKSYSVHSWRRSQTAVKVWFTAPATTDSRDCRTWRSWRLVRSSAGRLSTRIWRRYRGSFIGCHRRGTDSVQGFVHHLQTDVPHSVDHNCIMQFVVLEVLSEACPPSCETKAILSVRRPSF